MKIIGTQLVEVEVSGVALKEAFRKYVYNTFELQEDMYIKNGNIIKEFDYFAGGRCITEETIIRKCTEQDIENMEFIKQLKERNLI